MALTTNKVSFWRGTRAQFNALGDNTSPNTFYTVKEEDGRWSSFYGPQMIIERTGQLMPAKDILELAEFTADVKAAMTPGKTRYVIHDEGKEMPGLTYPDDYTGYYEIEKRVDGKFQVTDSSGVRWLLLAFVIVIAVRLTILLILSGGIDRENIVASIIVDYVFSLGALIFLAENAMRINARALEDREKARLAQYRYMNLSQQVNPHFLFNSLNILDCLVCEQKTDQASTYIHKLAAIYRYLLRNEEERLVKLRDEMDFVDQYVDLLKVRFPEGLDIQIDIPADRLNRRVVPCSVQLLIENATKHNAVSADKPLQIMVKCEDDCVVVSNTLNPKISSGPSTGLGLKYLREQYQDVAGKTPVVRMGENEYTVVIPLI